MTLLEALKKIKANPDTYHGICHNVFLAFQNEAEEVGHKADDKLTELFRSYPYAHRRLDGSLDLGFPVGGYMEFTNQAVDGTLWVDPKRIALLDWCIQTLEKENENNETRVD